MDPVCPACHTPAMPGDRHCASCGTRVSGLLQDRSAPATMEFLPLRLSNPPVSRKRFSRRFMVALAIMGIVMVGGLATAAYAVSEFGTWKEPAEATVSLDDQAMQIVAAEPFGDHDDRISDASSGGGESFIDVPGVLTTVTEPTPSPEPTPPPQASVDLVSGAQALHIPSLAVYHGAQEAAMVSRSGMAGIAQAVIAYEDPGDGTGGAALLRWHAGDGTGGAPAPV